MIERRIEVGKTGRSVRDSYDEIREHMERIRRSEGRDQPVPVSGRRVVLGENIAMVPAEDAPREATGLLRLRPEPSLSASRKPHFVLGKICSLCPLTRCRCHPHLPTHWGSLPDGLS